MRAIASRLTYANVVATLALVLAVGGGVAYAADTVFSDDIVDGEVKAQDIATNAVRSAKIGAGQVRGVDVAANGLTGDNIDESTLDNSVFSKAVSAIGSCTADVHGSYQTCASTTITLSKLGRIVVNGTGYWSTIALDDAFGDGSGTDDPNRATGACRVTVDTLQIGRATQAGEAQGAGSPPTHPSGAGAPIAITALSDLKGAGPHTVELQCQEIDGDLDWSDINLTALQVGP